MEFVNFEQIRSQAINFPIESVLTPPLYQSNSSSESGQFGVLIFILGAFILITVAANALICLAVCLVRVLRNPRYYLIVSLAVTDLLVAIAMFPALLYTHWTLSAFFCDAWIFFDQTVCTASILNLCMISLDRYWVITKPQEYLPQRTPLRMLFYVSIAWIGAFIVALPPVLFSDNVHANEKGEPVCLVSQKITYQIYATLITFYIPYGIMLCVYSKIFRARRCIARETMRRTTIEGPIQTDSNTSNLPPHQKKLRFKLARKFQASNIIGILVAAFTLCWAPFFVLALVRPFFNQSDVPDVITFSFLWLGYMNSLLNPIINMTLLHEFREPISKLLCCKWSELNLMRRKSTASERNSNYLVVKIDWL